MSMPDAVGDITLPEIFKEVKRTITVYLTPEGIELMRDRPFLRKEGYIACRKICDNTDPHYLYVEARYYSDGSSIPHYTYIGIPHRYILYLSSNENPSRIRKQNR